MPISILSLLALLLIHTPHSIAGTTPPFAVGDEQDNTTLRTYIIHVQPPPNSISFGSQQHHANYYKSFLSVPNADSRLVYSYTKAMSGFAAMLTEAEFSAVKETKGFLHAYPDRLVSLQTTHTPKFLGLNADSPGFWRDSKFGKGVIVGILDGGITPRHPSFRDEGMNPPPSRWKGGCLYNQTDCNNKLIGAKAFNHKIQSKAPGAVLPPYDHDGHGTHTASTAAGMWVGNASVDGQAAGTAAGIAPYAYIAAYKVCYDGFCSFADIHAGVDAALADGVDIISMSIGTNTSIRFDYDGIAISAFAAASHGVFVSCAAGNSGPTSGSVSNVAPWILTVGASTMDRTIRSTVMLGNGKSYTGETLYQPRRHKSTLVRLIYPGSSGGFDAAYCNGTLDGFHVKGMAVLCDDGAIGWAEKSINVKKAGGVAVIIANLQIEGYTTTAAPHVLPASHVSYADGLKIKAYINSTNAPTARITFAGTILGASPAPAVTYFSSRGPSVATPNLLKPDVIGPGMNVLAAWTKEIGLIETSLAPFNIDSGTSMATPHLSGVAALLKNSHPDWSPAMIRSAIITTAYTFANDGNPIRDQTLQTASLFAIGAGHVDPSKANNPGLVYDIAIQQYIAYICGLGYNDTAATAITGRSIHCVDYLAAFGAELNYPSFMVLLNDENRYTWTVTRNVTNVGDPNSHYAVQTSGLMGVSVTVNPPRLSFKAIGDIAQYSVTFAANVSVVALGYLEGYLRWTSSDGSMTVTSPIVVEIR